MYKQNTHVIFNKRVGPETFLLGLRSGEIAAEAAPGQFVMIQVSPGLNPLLRRPFSICGIQGDDLFLVLYRVVGQGTAILSRVRKGEKLPVLGPLGRGFEFPENRQKPLLVAGGMGTAPLLFLAQVIGSSDVTFMAGYRSADEILLIDEIGLSNMEISISTDDGTAGHRGPVTDLLEAQLGINSAGAAPVVFACGPLPMLKSVAIHAIDHDIPCQVSLETTMACGIGACQGCAVKSSSPEIRPYYHVCQDGPVFDVNVIDWKVL